MGVEIFLLQGTWTGRKSVESRAIRFTAASEITRGNSSLGRRRAPAVAMLSVVLRRHWWTSMYRAIDTMWLLQWLFCCGTAVATSLFPEDNAPFEIKGEGGARVGEKRAEDERKAII